jgi:phage terminase large subunit-like protein
MIMAQWVVKHKCKLVWRITCLALVVILSLEAVGIALPAPLAMANKPEGIDIAAWEWECVWLTNRLRAEHDLPPLKAESILMSAARAHSQDMAARGYVAHTTPEGVELLDRLQTAGYHSTSYYSENIRVGWRNTPETAIQWWYDEEPPDDWHRRNLLSVNHREFGCGIHIDPDSAYKRYFTQDFGQRRDIFPVIINHEATSTSQRAVSLYLYGQSWEATEMMLSEDAGFEGTVWQPFDPTPTWMLSPGSGQKAVCAKIRNASGEILGPVSDSILLIAQLDKRRCCGRRKRGRR